MPQYDPEQLAPAERLTRQFQAMFIPQQMRNIIARFEQAASDPSRRMTPMEVHFLKDELTNWFNRATSYDYGDYYLFFADKSKGPAPE
jgi:hypothetical protein